VTRGGDSGSPGSPLLESDPEHIVVLDSFLKEDTAAKLRHVFDERFENPREGKVERFVWDWWHVPGQYTLVSVCFSPSRT
ncbi:unnamed protein product, partial [Discosporangium mesarthrocarpum]